MADAAWANAKDEATQAGWIFMAGDSRICKGERGRVSPLAWQSRRLARRVPGSLAHGIYLKALFAQLAFSGLSAGTAPEARRFFP